MFKAIRELEEAEMTAKAPIMIVTMIKVFFKGAFNAEFKCFIK